MALNAFTPSGYGQLNVEAYVSASQAIPGGGGATLLVTNLGPGPAVVLLGSSSVVVTETTGVVVPPLQSLPITVGSNTHVAGLGIGAQAKLCLAQGA